MSNEYYDHTTYPTTGAFRSSSGMRAELAAIEAAFNKLPVLSGNGRKTVRVNAAGNALESSGVIDFLLGANIASAATIDLTSATGNLVHVTGTTAITAVTLGSGMMRQVIFDGILTLTHHATNNNLPGGANITTAAGDRALYWSDGTTVYCVAYSRANGKPVVEGVPAGPITTSGLTMATNRLLGRTTAGTGAVEEFSLAEGLEFSGSTVRPKLSFTQCQLIKSGSNLVLLPFGGNAISINGAVHRIPAAGISVAPPATNGITYQIYAYDNSGTLALEASTTASVVDTATGLHIKNGDATRTHVGVAITMSSAWVDTLTRRLVCGRYNQPRRPILYTLGSNFSGVGAPWVNLSTGTNIDFVTLDGAIDIKGFGSASDANAGALAYVSCGLDNAQVGVHGYGTCGSGAVAQVSAGYAAQVAAGYHSLQLYGGGINSTFTASYTGISGTV